jgi:hypothetical protein
MVAKILVDQSIVRAPPSYSRLRSIRPLLHKKDIVDYKERISSLVGDFTFPWVVTILFSLVEAEDLYQSIQDKIRPWTTPGKEYILVSQGITINFDYKDSMPVGKIERQLPSTRPPKTKLLQLDKVLYSGRSIHPLPHNKGLSSAGDIESVREELEQYTNRLSSILEGLEKTYEKNLHRSTTVRIHGMVMRMPGTSKRVEISILPKDIAFKGIWMEHKHRQYIAALETPENPNPYPKDPEEFHFTDKDVYIQVEIPSYPDDILLRKIVNGLLLLGSSNLEEKYKKSIHINMTYQVTIQNQDIEWEKLLPSFHLVKQGLELEYGGLPPDMKIAHLLYTIPDNLWKVAKVFS